MNLLLTLLVLIALLALWVFFDKFTKRGAVPVGKAAREFTTWLGLAGVAFADWIIALLQWVAGFWEPLQQTLGPALAAPGMDKFLIAWSSLMLALKFKGQTPAPALKFPDLPDDTDKAGA